MSREHLLDAIVVSSAVIRSEKGTAREVNMMRALSIGAIVGLLVASTSVADARISHRMGASGFAPGHMMHRGSIRGASAFAPGHLMHRFGSVRGHPGASGFAPGHRFR